MRLQAPLIIITRSPVQADGSGRSPINAGGLAGGALEGDNSRRGPFLRRFLQQSRHPVPIPYHAVYHGRQLVLAP